jgi:RNA-directed DNA polymerase
MAGFRGLTTAKLAKQLGCQQATLRSLAARADRLYRVVPIEIGSKARTLTIPSDQLKRLQRILLRGLFYQLPTLECLGHARRRGVVWTLKRHAGHSHLFHVDLKGFFPSVTPDRVRRCLLGLKVGDDAADVITRLVTYRGELPQGAPTSVAVGDAVLYLIDKRILGIAAEHGLTYSRYVDDITLSGPGALVSRFSTEIVQYLEDDGWQLSEEKGGLYGPDDSHRMLKAIVNRKPNVNDQYYSGVREQLRGIARFGIEPSTAELESLAAQVTWIATVNPDRHPPLTRLLQEALASRNGGSEVSSGADATDGGTQRQSV